MSQVSPTLPLSHIIASDAPLLSPLVSSSDADHYHHLPLYSPTLVDNYAMHYYGLPPSPPHSTGSNGTNSPIPSNRMRKMRMSPDSLSENDQLCIPTHQVFDFPEVQNHSSPESDSPSPQMLRRSISISSAAPSSKRELSLAPSTTKKPRAAGERITTKDFIPPDVSGLSKREARLVKNRAAAFLSRQRKREEFETMEVRVAELEQENAALRALTQNGSSSSSHPKKGHSNDELLSEIEQLRAQLAAAGERELELSAELERQAESQHGAIKIEAAEPQFPPSPIARTAPVAPPHKSGASLGLMVLLCALPTLLSMPTHNTPPTSFSLPITGPSTLPASSSTFDYNSIIPNDYDWLHNPSGTMMDLDVDEQGRISTRNTPKSSTNFRRLQFVDVDSEALGLGDLDISFEASPSENGKIRVRIHSSPPDAVSSSDRSELRRRSSSSSLAMWAGSQSDPNYGTTYSPPTFSAFPPPSSTSDCDPFLGANAAFGLGSPMSVPMSMGEFSSVGFGHHTTLGSDFTGGAGHVGGKRRVRIALKSMPTLGGEGGEWEVEVR